MLILERREMERIYVDVAGVRIVVVLTEIKSKAAVKIGIGAPPEVKILRAELETEV